MNTSLPSVVKLALISVFVLGLVYAHPPVRADSVSSQASPYNQGFKHRGWTPRGYVARGYRPYFGYIPPPYYHLPYWGGSHIGRIYGPRPHVVVPYIRERSGYPRVNTITPAGRLVLKVHPEHALVLVDGYPLVQTGQSTYEIGLLVGEHRVEAQAQGHNDYNESVVIKKGQRHIIEIMLRAE